MRRGLIILILLTTPLLAQTGEMDRTRRGIRALHSRMKLTKAQLAEANAKEKKMAKILAATQLKLDAAQAEYDEIKARYDKALARLKKIRKKIGITRARLRGVQGKLENRLRDLYIEGEVSYLAVLLQSDDFTDFLNQAEYLKMILDTDHELILEVRQRRHELERQKSAAKRSLDELCRIKAVKEVKVAELRKIKSAQDENMARVPEGGDAGARITVSPQAGSPGEPGRQDQT